VQRAPGIPCALKGGKRFQNSGRACREKAEVCQNAIVSEASGSESRSGVAEIAGTMEIIGHAPELAGLLCEAFICEGFVHKGEPIANANAVYLCFAGAWHSLVIDCGVIIWRPAAGQPSPSMIESEGWEYPHVDVGAISGGVGLRLKEYRMATTAAAGKVTFLFENGRAIVIDNEDDRSTCRID
jgi:hypothetical protein